jgi:hypothetical protein
MMRAAGQEIRQEGPLQTESHGAAFGFFRYVVDRSNPAGSSCDSLFASGAGCFDAATSQRRSWGRVRRRCDGEHIRRADYSCVEQVHGLARGRLFRDYPPSRRCLFAPGERPDEGPAGIAQCGADTGPTAGSHPGCKPGNCPAAISKPGGDSGALAGFFAGWRRETGEVPGIGPRILRASRAPVGSCSHDGRAARWPCRAGSPGSQAGG